ncbi:MAG: hypothetical protein JO222_11795, partial [Frankiales bacterium]|nr:hypothetical protein [Frankiales bacterium]
MILPIKAGAEALDRTDDLAQAWLYACHAGAKVIISVTADLGYSSYMNQAIRYCWKRGVLMAESSNDFDSLDHQGGMFHPFVIPGNGNVPNTMGYDSGGSGSITNAAINADTTTSTSRSDETSWGTHAMFSASTQGGSTSESTPTIAGAFALLLSWGRQAAAKGDIKGPLDAAEAIQVMRATAYKITDPSLPWPGTSGDWNDQYGYGRPNLFAAMRAVAHDDVPPVAWITTPAWYSLHDPGRQKQVVVTGHVAAPRSSSYRWKLQWGLTPPRTCSSFSTEPTTWHTIGHGKGHRAYDGKLGTLKLSAIPSSFARAPYSLSKCKQLETNDKYAVTLRVRVWDAKKRMGEDRRAIAVHHESGQLPGFPLPLKPSHPVPGMTIDGTSQPAYADLQGRGRLALVFGDADGRVHAIDPKTRRELPGWPVLTRRTRPDHAYKGIDPGHEPILVPVAIGDLRHNGQLDVVATSTTGRTYVWDARGRLLHGWPKTLDKAAVTPRIPRPRLRFTRLPHLGATAVPVLTSLAGGKKLDVVQAAWDGDVYAWNAAGRRVPGWPVHVNGKALTPPGGDIRIDDAKIDTPPAVAYLDGTGKPDIVVVSQYDFTPGAGIQEAGYGNDFAYNAKGKLLPGWPVSKQSLIVYYGSAQEFLTEGSTAPVSARVTGSTDSVAVSPGIFSVSYLLGPDGATQTTYGPNPNPAAGIFSGAYDPTQLASGNLPADTPVTFTTTGAFGHFTSSPSLGYAQAGSGAATVATALLLNGSGTAIASYERGYDAASGADAPGFPGHMQGLD